MYYFMCSSSDPFVTAPSHVPADAEPMAILSLSLDARFDGRELLTKYIRTSAEQVSENGSTSAVAWHSFAHDFCCFFMLFYAFATWPAQRPLFFPGLHVWPTPWPSAMGVPAQTRSLDAP